MFPGAAAGPADRYRCARRFREPAKCSLRFLARFLPDYVCLWGGNEPLRDFERPGRCWHRVHPASAKSLERVAEETPSDQTGSDLECPLSLKLQGRQPAGLEPGVEALEAI